MSDYILSKPEILALALAPTDAGAILGTPTDWIEPRKFDCPNCWEIGAEGVRRAKRDEVCLYGYSRDTSLSQIWDKHVYAMSRIMPCEVGERAIGAGFITFLMA